MARPFVRFLPLCVLIGFTGCGEREPYDLDVPLMRPDPGVVTLPYEETLNKGGLRISIRPIPGRTDAVQVIAKMSGYYESPTVEWTQEGCSLKQLPFDKGLERYDFEFLELRPSGDTVGEVKLSIANKVKTGSR